ncbi:hypothetical protein [Amphritea atlantica]|nr:hypothetical protein [Amphritea atlantica]
MPEMVFDYWCAYQRLQNPEYREAALWDAMDDKDRLEAQEAAVLDIIRSGKAVAEKRAGG